MEKIENIVIKTVTERNIWVSMFNAALQGLCANSQVDPSILSQQAARAADQGLYELRYARIVMGCRADEFSRED